LIDTFGTGLIMLAGGTKQNVSYDL